jgi:anaerobic ribonucleoside-triphosphate reductase activating protein
MFKTAGIEYHNRTSAPWVSTEIFASGCYKNCPGCFNQKLRDPNYGRLISEEDVIADLIENVPYKRVTFSGGEPFIQAESLAKIAKGIRKEGFVISCYTGYIYEDLPILFKGAKDLLQNIDILVEGPFIKELLTPIDEDFKFVGSSNHRIINVQESLRQDKVVTWTEKELREIKEESNGQILG